MKRMLASGRWRNAFCLWMLGMATMLDSGTAYGQPAQELRLSEREVACQPAGDWLHQFPAISTKNDEIAVLTEPDQESGIVSLQVLRIVDEDFRLEQEFPLFISKHTNWKDCVEDLEAGRHQQNVGSLEIISAANARLSDNGFSTMLPLDARSLHGVTIETLPPQPEEVISWDRYHISVDYQQGEVIIKELLEDDDGAFLITEPDFGKTYFELQLPIKKGPDSHTASESCIGMPVPLAIWTNKEAESSNEEIFLLLIGYVSSKNCGFSKEWIVER